jgi:hypothetical protein
MVWTLKGRGLALLVAVPLLGAVPAAHADGPGPSAHKGDKGSHSKPAHKHKVHKHKSSKHKPSKHKHSKHESSKHKGSKGSKHKGSKGSKHEGRVMSLRMRSPKQAVVPGRTYTWTFTVAARGKGTRGKAAFKATLPRTLAYVSGEKHCKSAGQKVYCRLGTLEKGEEATGTIRAKVTRRAKPGARISPRGTAVWGRNRVTHRFPAVRVARTAVLALPERAPATARSGAEIPYTPRHPVARSGRDGYQDGNHASSNLH